MYSNYDLGKKVQSLDVSPTSEAYLGVIIYTSEEDDSPYGSYGDISDSSRVLELTAPICTSTERATEIAKNIYNSIKGKQYVPFSAGNAALPPIYSLGDSVTIGDTTAIIAKQSLKLDSMNVSDISAPSEEDIDNEIEYVSETDRKTKRQFSTQKADYTSKFEINAQAISTEVTAREKADEEWSTSILETTGEQINTLTETVNENYSTLTQTATEISTKVSSVSTKTDTAYNRATCQYGTCSTAAATAAKVVSCTDFELYKGATIAVKFTYKNEAASPTLNVNKTGAKPIYAYGAALTADSSYNWSANSTGYFTYNGSQWEITDSSALSQVSSLTETVNENYSTLMQTATEIKAEVKSVYENVQHDYCVNGDFSDGTENWTVNDSSAVYVGSMSDGTKWAILDRTSESAAYLYQKITVGTAGAFKIRFTAYTGSDYTSTARIKCMFNNTSKYTEAGELLATGGTVFEFDYNVTTTGTKRLYLYNYVDDTKVFITDVEILGYISGYAESEFKILSDEISLKVTEEDVEAKLALTISDGVASLSANADKISLTSGQLVITSGQLKLDSSGNATFSGKLSAATGTFSGSLSAATGTFSGSITTDNGVCSIKINSGRIYGYYGDDIAGYISTYHKCNDKIAMRIAGYGGITLATPHICVYDGYVGPGTNATVSEGQTGTLNYIKSIVDNGNGTISWTASTLKFVNGIMITSLS